MKNVAKEQGIEGYYFPKGEDDATGKKQHEKLKGSYISDNPYDTGPTFESFRDYCFGEAERDKEVKDCNGTYGGCTNCIRDKTGN